ncbi:hypothetical protein [Thermomonospora cellulosilytica]|uniref:Uncharacterized protein n=1 Tax=Thermomonospora cellulosilytica TaxID=1411118 RepID=A0A7W3MTT5_9ACTN|nr:hypothetical protein [Thermomonospora cellulosilytica]MBA9001728.1 hypothetical protein [Thermomonospora cellulosilytica]
MSFDRGRRAAGKGDRPVLVNDRRTFLQALDEAVRGNPGLACGIVTRDGVPVLCVINSEMPQYKAEIGADFIDGDWRFVWAVSGEAIGPVDDLEGAVAAIARAVRVNGQARP